MNGMMQCINIRLLYCCAAKDFNIPTIAVFRASMQLVFRRS